ncbi:Asp23/Gls24 family envelope stress response protein [Mycolicibacterium sp. 018/SC-01/001]|uniref:Asp23/Gls24 family envelope stress response protein n=1 Tax=Mycolicibacterium sp. 018/SC-01/001 TaxID=2592069 RepID=UPI00117EF9E7|nr:Asp23/Gls24 family envelope stress response protein [Mycolicibacterium sp. 018/SC-01/001]TRW86353.1 Asp23/Gls24 family envelope stress response protein [Mycolicibacterium sp. 018/SC-01/001]
MTTPSTTVAKAATGPLVTTQGSTTIADVVVSKIAGLAAREVHGVHDLGGNASRAVGALRDRIPGASTNYSQGVSVEVGEKQAAIDLDIVAEYGVSISDVAAGIRRNVIAALERMTGLEVVEVNITVHDVHVPDDDTDKDTEDRSARVE